jgi:cyclophilin family peptidyl-prolyl cis-trans isomerase
MAASKRRYGWGVSALAGAAWLGLVTGCGSQPATPADNPGTPTAAKPDTTGSGGKLAEGTLVKNVKLDPRLHQSYELAVSTDIPDGFDVPPDQTATGKSTGKLHDQVHRAWDHIMFELPTGKQVVYTATLDTELGPVVISLRQDLAPNHVRNFVALAQHGYFDGLVFEKIVHQAPEDGTPGDAVDLVEAGCPLGTGDYQKGHLGYFLKPEFDPQALHMPGTVGAWHGADDATACSRFYITLGKTPAMDGRYTVFGQVTQGLDVVERLHKMPTETGADGQKDKPVKPVAVRKVTILAEEVEKPAAPATN